VKVLLRFHTENFLDLRGRNSRGSKSMFYAAKVMRRLFWSISRRRISKQSIDKICVVARNCEKKSRKLHGECWISRLF